MATTQPSDIIVPTILAEEFSKGIAGLNAMDEYFTANPGLQAGINDVGSNVVVPYFESTGKAQQVPAGAALTPKKLSMSSETGTVIHLGDAISTSGWAQRAKASGRSLYEVATEQLLAGFKSKLNDLMAAAIIVRAIAKSMVFDGSAGQIDIPAIVGLQRLFGDELMSNGGIRSWVMNSKPYWDAATLADSTGRPLLTQIAGEELMRLGGKPVKMSDVEDLLVGSTSPQQYYTVAAKAGAAALWYNDNVAIETDRDVLADNDLLVYHVYCVVHAYGCMPGGTKPGVAAAKTR